jgi:hypothetical protein
MREVFERLEKSSVPWFLTGSEALARYGQPRQTMDVDVVLDLPPHEFASLVPEFEQGFLVNEPISFGGRWMASLISTSTLGKVDLILGRDDAWGRAAMGRRERWDHPIYVPVWVTTLEDLILAKLDRSGGSSELQARDCRHLITTNRGTIDWTYLERWARALGVDPLLEAARDAP